MKLRREHLIIAALLLVLLAATIASGFFQSQKEQIPPLSSNSNQPDGARALRLWLSEVGFEVSNRSIEEFRIPDHTDAVVILEPSATSSITTPDWETLDQWLGNGGTLFFASTQIGMELSNSPLEVDGSFSLQRDVPVLPAAPIFQAPPFSQPAKMTYLATLKANRSDAQPLLVTKDGIVGLLLKRHAGKVILLSGTSFLTNQNLKDPGNAALLINLFSLIPQGSRIWIDEWHHGERGSNAPGGYGPEAWLTSTPGGFAVLFSAAVIFLGLVLRGKPFGRPVPLVQAQNRRRSLEYVTALANLNRRAGHHHALIQSYHSAIKRSYGRRYRLDPGLSDAEYVSQIAHYNPSLDSAALLHLLQRLDQKRYSELQVVALAREASDWLSKLER